MTQAILALDENNNRVISMHTSDNAAQRKWAEHESQQVLCTWRYARKLFWKLKTPLATSGTEAPEPPASSRPQTHLTRVYHAIAAAVSGGSDACDSERGLSDAQAENMPEWPKYPHNSDDHIEMSDESDEEDAASEKETVEPPWPSREKIPVCEEEAIHVCEEEAIPVCEEESSEVQELFARATWVSDASREEFEDRMECMRVCKSSPLFRIDLQ